MGPLPKPTKKQKGMVMFDPQAFLAIVGAARTITECPKDYKIFSQGDPANAVFYIQQGRVKVKVKSKQSLVFLLFFDSRYLDGCRVEDQSIVLDSLSDDISEDFLHSSDGIIPLPREVQVACRSVWSVRPKFEEKSTLQNKLIVVTGLAKTIKETLQTVLGKN
jgi:hypothetical protein